MTVRNLDEIGSFTASLKRDDGAIIYVNGHEVARSNMPAGEVNYRTRAVSTLGGDDESIFVDLPIDKSVFQEGANVIAVEIHQVSPSSSDISFDLELGSTELGSTSGEIYYTIDGSDPRTIGGGVAHIGAPLRGLFLKRWKARKSVQIEKLRLFPFYSEERHQQLVDESLLAVTSGFPAETIERIIAMNGQL